MAKIAGGCLCGKVRYSAEGEPVFVGVCHCTDCQKFTGSAFAAVVAVPKPAFSMQGKVTTYSKIGDSGKSISRQFCPECGSSIADEADAMPGVVMIASGTLDDSSWVKPGTADLLRQCPILGEAGRGDAELREAAWLMVGFSLLGVVAIGCRVSRHHGTTIFPYHSWRAGPGSEHGLL